MRSDQIDGIADQRQFAGRIDHDQAVAGRRNESGADFGLDLPQALLQRDRFDSARRGARHAARGLGGGDQIHVDRALLGVFLDRIADITARQDSQRLLPLFDFSQRQVDER